MNCDFAACKRPADVRQDGWWFCATHLREHFAFQREHAGRNTPRRCWWCGDWALAHSPCDTCTSPAVRPPRSIRKEDTA